MYERLVERIMGGVSDNPVAPDPSRLLNDVIDHLRELFNVRQGSVPIRPDYGMLDINSVIHQFPDAIDVLQAEIRRQIETFEPRLAEVSVRHVAAPERPLSLVFRISAMLADGETRVTLETEVGGDGVVRVTA